MNTLTPGGHLGVNQELRSNNGLYVLIMQGDGNLVLYESVKTPPLKAVWSTNTWNLPPERRPNRAAIQQDGNFVLYSTTGAEWASGTWTFPGSRLVLQDDRNLVIYDSNNTARWASNTTQLTLRIMAWNISEGNYSGHQPDNSQLPALAEQIRSKNPHLVLLNEVMIWNVGQPIDAAERGVNQLARLGELAGLRYWQSVRAARHFIAGTKVVGVLSQYPLDYPIGYFPVWRYKTGWHDEYAMIETWCRMFVPGLSEPIVFAVYSLRFPPMLTPEEIKGNKEGLRLATDYFRNMPRRMVICGGDFNAPITLEDEGHPEINNLEEYKSFVQNSGLTKAYPELKDGACVPDDRITIDHIFYRGPFTVTQSEIGCPWDGPSNVVSNHGWIFLELEVTQPAECGQLRAQISPLKDRIRVLEERKRRLDPKRPLDREKIEVINDQISEIDAQLSPLRQRQTAIGCWF